MLEEPLGLDVWVPVQPQGGGPCAYVTVSWEQLPDDFLPAGDDAPLEATP